jgi:hypothetical protein
MYYNKALIERETPQYFVYINSKWEGEIVASKYASKNNNIIILRPGWINFHNTPNRPDADANDKKIFCSHEDFKTFVVRLVDSLIKNINKTWHPTYFICSKNAEDIIDMQNAKDDLNWSPTASSEEIIHKTQKNKV